ncbi:MAG TPA: cystathionine beta-lyase [Blastocatellia bacterium]|nr:cystathionine beta-lyase [Blastocatellia bacterium]
MKTSTRCVRPEGNEDPYCAVAPPIYQTATFRQPTATEFGEYDYTRTSNPTRRMLENQLARLEGGTFACAFASGMAAITAVAKLAEWGDEIIAGDDLYGGTVRLLDQVLPRQGVNVVYADTTDAAAVARAITPRTKLILVETPTNPQMHISDLRELAQLARDAGVLLAVDNSMLSPVLQQPLALGADLVIHSATKYLCGHSDVTGGVVVTNDEELYRRIAFQQNAEGAGISPFESWLLLRGIKTLALRVERQNATAQQVAQFLAAHPAVEKVFYAGLPSHPGYEIQQRQAKGAGGVISFTTGDESFSQALVEATQLFDIAVSFGSVNSSISLPCRMSHASIPAALREKLAPPADLIRLSIGIEDAEDLLDDLQQAFAAAAAKTARELVTAAFH